MLCLKNYFSLDFLLLRNRKLWYFSNYHKIFPSSFEKKITSLAFTEILFEKSTFSSTYKWKCQFVSVHCAKVLTDSYFKFSAKLLTTLRCVLLRFDRFFLLLKGFINFINSLKFTFFTFSGVAGSAQKPPSKFILNMSGESESCSSAMSSLESVRSSEVKIFNKMSLSNIFFDFQVLYFIFESYAFLLSADLKQQFELSRVTAVIR